MKKTIKALWLLLIAATILTSCSFGNKTETKEEKQQKKEEKSKENDLCKKLFDYDKLTTIKTNKWQIEEEGKWTYRFYKYISDEKKYESTNVYFTYTDGKIDWDKDIKVIHQVKYSKEIPQSVVDRLKDEGYEKYTDLHWYKETKDKAKIKAISEMEYAEYSKKYFEKTVNAAFADSGAGCIPHNGQSIIGNDIKTNDEHTMFAWNTTTNKWPNYCHYLQKD